MEEDIIKTLSIVSKLPVDEKECLIRVMSEMKDAINVLNGMLLSRKEENDSLRTENTELSVNKGRNDIFHTTTNALISKTKKNENENESKKKAKEDGKREKKELAALEVKKKKETAYLGTIAAFSDSEPLQLLHDKPSETLFLSSLNPFLDKSCLDNVGIADFADNLHSNNMISNLQYFDKDDKAIAVNRVTNVTNKRPNTLLLNSDMVTKVAKTNVLASDEAFTSSAPNQRRQSDTLLCSNSHDKSGCEFFLQDAYEQETLRGKKLSIHMRVGEQIKLFDGILEISYDPRYLKEIFVCLLNNISNDNVHEIAKCIEPYSVNILFEAILCYISDAIETFLNSLLSSSDPPSLSGISSYVLIKAEMIISLMKSIVTRCHQGKKYKHDLEIFMKNYVLRELSSRVEVPLLYIFSKINCDIKYKNLFPSGSTGDDQNNSDKQMDVVDSERDTPPSNNSNSKTTLLLDFKLMSLSYILTAFDIKFECGNGIYSFLDEINSSIQAFGITYVGPIFGLLESFMASTYHSHLMTHNTADLYNTFSILYFEIKRYNTKEGDFSFQESKIMTGFDRRAFNCSIIRKQIVDKVENKLSIFVDKSRIRCDDLNYRDYIFERLTRCNGDNSRKTFNEAESIVECLIEESRIIKNYAQTLQDESSSLMANQMSGFNVENLKTIPFLSKRVGFWSSIQMMRRHSEDSSIGVSLSELGLSYLYDEAADLIKLSEYSFLKAVVSPERRTACEVLLSNLRPFNECGDKQFAKYYAEKKKADILSDMLEIENCVLKSFKNFWNNIFCNDQDDKEGLMKRILLNCRFIFALVDSCDNTIDSSSYVHSSHKTTFKSSDSLYDLSTLLDKKLKSGRQIATKCNFTSISTAFVSSTKMSPSASVFCATSATPESVLNASIFFDHCMAFGDKISSHYEDNFTFQDYSNAFSRTTREIISLLSASYFERFLFFLSCSIRSLVSEIITNKTFFENGTRENYEKIKYSLCNALICFLGFNRLISSGTVRSDILRDCVVLARKIPSKYLSQRVKEWVILSSYRLPVFVINLDYRYDRWKNTLIQCKENFLTAIRCRAIDGKNISKEGVTERRNCEDEIVSENDVAWTYSGHLLSKYDPTIIDNKKIPTTPSERACAASHINVWRAISNFRKGTQKSNKTTLKSNLLLADKDVVLLDVLKETVALSSMGSYYQKFERFEEMQTSGGSNASRKVLQSQDWYVIFEDDAQIKKTNLVTSYKEYNDTDSKYRTLATFIDILIRDELPNDFDIFVLGCKHPVASKKDEKKRKSKKKIDDRIIQLHFFFQLHSYIITGNAIEKILLNHLPVYGPIDAYLSELITQNKLMGYTLTDSAIDQCIHHNGINTVGRADVVKSGRKK